jgi:transcriptional regulator with XRE-family HTH domain
MCALGAREELGSRLRRARNRRGLRREDLAVESGISWSAIAQIESGRRQNVRPDTLSALARALSVPIDYLLHGTAPPPLLEHRALFHGGRDGFVDGVGSFVAEGVERAEPTLAVTTETNVDALREFLGRDAKRVHFMRSDELYREPGAALTTYLRFARRELARAGWARIVGGPPWGRKVDAKAKRWSRYESLLNLACATLPVTIVCPYDESAVAPSILKQARATHPELITNGAIEQSRAYVDPGMFVLGD